MPQVMGGNYPRTADRSAGWQSDAFSISGKRVRQITGTAPMSAGVAPEKYDATCDVSLQSYLNGTSTTYTSPPPAPRNSLSNTTSLPLGEIIARGSLK